MVFRCLRWGERCRGRDATAFEGASILHEREEGARGKDRARRSARRRAALLSHFHMAAKKCGAGDE
jgi:hypothetical protein